MVFYTSKYSPSETFAIIASTSALVILIVVLNLTTLTVFFVRKSLRIYSDYFVINLAVADLAVGLVAIPVNIPYMLTDHWPWGRGFCLFWLLVDFIATSASAFCVCLISLDRYLLVSHFTWYMKHQSSRLLLLMLLTPWCIAAIIYGPSVLLWEMAAGEEKIAIGQCYAPFARSKEFTKVLVSVVLVTPIVFLSFMNLSVYLTLLARQRRRKFSRSISVFATAEPTLAIPRLYSLQLKRQSETRRGGRTASLSHQSPGSERATFGSNTDNVKQIIELTTVDESPQGSASVSVANHRKLSVRKQNRVRDVDEDAADVQGKQRDLTADRETRESEDITSGDDRRGPRLKNRLTLDTVDDIINIPIPEGDSGSGKLSRPSADIAVADSRRSSEMKRRSSLESDQSALGDVLEAKMAKGVLPASERLNEEKDGARFLFVLVFIFVLCRVPFGVNLLISLYCPTCPDPTFYAFSFWLMWINSAINPFIYVMLNSRYRKGYRRLFNSSACCKQG